MRRILLACLVAIVVLVPWACAVVYAQPAPFDMSTERPPASASPPPPSSLPRATPVPGQEKQPLQSPRIEPSPPSPAAIDASTDVGRYIIPAENLVLAGEYSRNAWTVYLTAEQAKAGDAITIAYQSAIVVAPEASDIVLSINNRRIGEEHISSPNETKSVRWSLPPGLLRAGSNDFEIVVNQRHRTDCDVRSTYDLWTHIDASGSYLHFSERQAPATSAIEAVRALGPDQYGLTHFRMIVPSIGPIDAVSPLLRLSQGLVVMNGMPNPQFSFHQEMPAPDTNPGALRIVVGTAAELATILPDLPAGSDAGPVGAVMPQPDGNAPVVVITGPSWEAVASAVEAFIAPITRSPTLRRDAMPISQWATADAPFVFGGETLSFSQLGVGTTEFSGRRFRTGFHIAVPSDFYAGAYGEAVIRLDAAYGASIAGGSHFDVYVNGNIASTIPVNNDGGALLQKEPIRVTMRHFRPGINHVELEAVLLAEADEVCTPGTSGSLEERFAIFDSSSFHMPRYARIGQTPNLAALSGTGAPYSRQREPTAIFIDHIDTDMLSAVANLLGKVAQVSGSPIALEPIAAASAVGGRNAIYIGTADQLPTTVLSQLNIDSNRMADWHGTKPDMQENEDAAATVEAWRGRLRGGFFSQKMETFADWLKKTLDLSDGALRFLPGPEAIFSPGPADNLLLAQGLAPDGEGIWTVLTAPDSEALRVTSNDLARQENWYKVSGRLVTYSGPTDEINAWPATRQSFLTPIDSSPGNYRLILANWLSSNLLSYALLVVFVACVLGITTSTLLRWIGRQ